MPANSDFVLRFDVIIHVILRQSHDKLFGRLSTLYQKAAVTTIKENHFYTEWIGDDDQMFTRMLYDHSADPDENVNISEHPENAVIIEELSDEMRRSRAGDYFKEGLPTSY